MYDVNGDINMNAYLKRCDDFDSMNEILGETPFNGADIRFPLH